MPTVRQTHRQYGVAGLGECGVHREIRSGPRMRLDVDVLGAEQRLCPIDRQILGYVDVLAPAVVTPTRIALGVLVAQVEPKAASTEGLVKFSLAMS